MGICIRERICHPHCVQFDAEHCGIQGRARIKIPVGIGVGYEPSLYNPTEKLTNNISVTGQILGTQIESARIEESLTFDVIDPDWIASNWMTIRSLMRTVGVFLRGT